MKFRKFFTNEIILRLSDLATGLRIYDCLKFLRDSQFWDRAKIDEYQNKKLRELIIHAYRNVPYYRELFDKNNIKPSDIQTKEDLYKIPITTKNDLKKSNLSTLASNIRSNNLLYRSSSGSTGEPFQFYTTKKAESFAKASAIRGWNWMGYKFGDRYVKLSMNPRSSFLKKIQDKLNNCLYLSVNQLSPKALDVISKKIQLFDPTFIRGYPIPLQCLGKIHKEKSFSKANSLKAINTTGSTLLNGIRADIESAFNVRIYDAYSCEGGACFHQCEKGIYHPAEEYAISEFVEDNFTKTSTERPLRHITTDLHNLAFPFIRYDTQDYIVLREDNHCECGRNLINIKRILGRDGDILVTPSGKYLIVENFVAYFEWIEGIDQIQVIQDKIDEITMNIVTNKKFNNSTLNKIQDYWNNYIGENVIVSLKVVKEIKLTKTGKRRTVIRNPNIKL